MQVSLAGEGMHGNVTDGGHAEPAIHAANLHIHE